MTEPWDRVFSLAERGRFSVSPNPRVGSLVVSREGVVVGEGFHKRAGSEHAEAAALKAAGPRARGATLYVNLEPCAHQGRTPPCVDAILAAGVERVFCSIADPDPRTAGAGIAKLVRNGVAVEVGAEAEKAERLNEPFLVSVRKGRPFVHLKWASSLDGKIATSNGESRWISGEESRSDSMLLREELDAILVGAGTVLVDDPLLTRRLGLASSIVPHRRIILDGRVRVSVEARVFGDSSQIETWLVTARRSDDPAFTPFRDRGVLVKSLPESSERVDIRALLELLGNVGARSLLVEGGGATAWSFLEKGLVDRVTAYIAPKLLGGAGAPSPISGAGVSSLKDAPTLFDAEFSHLGKDLKVTGRLEPTR